MVMHGWISQWIDRAVGHEQGWGSRSDLQTAGQARPSLGLPTFRSLIAAMSAFTFRFAPSSYRTTWAASLPNAPTVEACRRDTARSRSDTPVAQQHDKLLSHNQHDKKIINKRFHLECDGSHCVTSDMCDDEQTKQHVCQADLA